MIIQLTLTPEQVLEVSSQSKEVLAKLVQDRTPEILAHLISEAGEKEERDIIQKLEELRGSRPWEARQAADKYITLRQAALMAVSKELIKAMSESPLVAETVAKVRQALLDNWQETAIKVFADALFQTFTKSNGMHQEAAAQVNTLIVNLSQHLRVDASKLASLR